MNGFSRFFRKSFRLVLLLIMLMSHTTISYASPSESVVTIYVQSGRSSSSQGTGFVIDNKGHIATAYHVVQDAAHLEAFDSAFRKLDPITIKWIDPHKDIAILYSEAAKDLPALRVSTSIPNSPEEIRVAGSPRGLPKQIVYGRITSESYVSSLGIFSAGGQKIFTEKIDVLPIDITVYSGMSGAPVINGSGAVTGLLSGSFDEGRGIGWAIPAKYIAELISTKPLDKRLDQMSWPPLSLMSSSWVSLKRSYAKKFSSDHLAQLELLEGAFTTLRGEWKGGADIRSVMYDDLNLGRCESRLRQKIKLDIDSVDQDLPQIRGNQTTEVFMEAVFTDTPYPLGDQLLSQQRSEFCSERVFQDKQRTDGNVTLSGGFFLYTHVEEGIPPLLGDLTTTSEITDCDGDMCSARVYGKQKSGKLELISNKKIRWQDSILLKQ